MSDNLTIVEIAGVGSINATGFTCTPKDGSAPKNNGLANYRMNKGSQTAEGSFSVSKDDFTIYLTDLLGKTVALVARNAAWEARTGKTDFFESATCYLFKEGENKNELGEEASDEDVEVRFVPLGEFKNLGVLYAEGQIGEAVA